MWKVSHGVTTTEGRDTSAGVSATRVRLEICQRSSCGARHTLQSSPYSSMPAQCPAPHVDDQPESQVGNAGGAPLAATPCWLAFVNAEVSFTLINEPKSWW